MISITYRPKLGDLVHAARVCDGHQRKALRLAVGFVMLACSFFLICVQWYVWASLFILFGVIELFNLLPSQVIGALIQWKTNPKFGEEHHLTLTTEELHFRTATIDSTIKWTFYIKYLESKKAFVLIYGKSMYSVIPKRALASPEQITEFRNLLASVLGAK
jgi:hypothetical protein